MEAYTFHEFCNHTFELPCSSGCNWWSKDFTQRACWDLCPPAQIQQVHSLSNRQGGGLQAPSNPRQLFSPDQAFVFSCSAGCNWRCKVVNRKSSIVTGSPGRLKPLFKGVRRAFCKTTEDSSGNNNRKWNVPCQLCWHNNTWHSVKKKPR